MAVERFANAAQTTLTAPIVAGNASIVFTVFNASAFPSAGNFRVRIDNELMLVTAVSGTSWTATRPVEDTTGAAHAAGATVTQVLTAAAMNALGAISADQAANTVLAGPAAGGVGAPAFRALAATDLPGFNASGQGYPSGPTFLLALGAPATTGTNKTNAVIAPRAGTITKAFAAAKTGPTGADLIFDINVNGTTIWSTQANRLKIAAGATSGTQTTFNTTTVAEGALLTIDIDQVGSTVAGQDVTVYLLTLLQNS